MKFKPDLGEPLTMRVHGREVGGQALERKPAESSLNRSI